MTTMREVAAAAGVSAKTVSRVFNEDPHVTPETRARATAVAGTIRTDGATVAAKLLLDAVRPELPTTSA